MASKALSKARRRRGTCRAENRCSLCGVGGMDTNEFMAKSKYKDFPYIVFSKGTDDEPAGDCLKCDTAWALGGFADEFGSQEAFRHERETDIGLRITKVAGPERNRRRLRRGRVEASWMRCMRPGVAGRVS